MATKYRTYILEGSYKPPALEFEINFTTHWIVEENTFCDGWTNTWSDGENRPVFFHTKESAEEELKTFLKDQKVAFQNGLMQDEYSKENYRVVPKYLEQERKL